MVEAKEKCSKCNEVKARKEFTPLASGAKPRCIACIDKAAKVNELKNEIERYSAKLTLLKEELRELNGVIKIKPPQPQEKIVHKITMVKHELKMHPSLPLGMKTRNSKKVYVNASGGIKPITIKKGKFGEFVSYYCKRDSSWKNVSLKNLEQSIFKYHTQLGV
jgi:hypothetical protein